jgi:hypothetical protein
MSEEPVYEMLWDCEACDAKGLLGVTHRFCPHCGRPQNPDRRYFPTEENKVAVANHVYSGADKICPACDASSGAKADFCGVCGSPLDAAKGVKLVAEGTSLRGRTIVGATPPAAAPAGSSRNTWIAIAVVVGLVVVCCGVLGYQKPASATVSAIGWERSVAVETFRAVQEGEWRSSVPAGAYAQRCTERDHGTRDEQDGETCTKSNVDQGDGSFKQVEECKPKYKKVPVKDLWCDFTIDKWVNDREERTSGQDNTSARAWPNPTVTGCAALGCTRLGAKREALKADVKLDGAADVTSCEVPEAVWSGLKVGQAVTVSVNLAGSVNCDDLKPAP